MKKQLQSTVTTEKNKNGFFKVLWTEVLNLLKNPKKLIPTFALCGIWLAFSLMSGFGVNLPFFRFLYTLTYAKGGMLGGFFGTVGGIFGKAVFAAVVNSVVLSICEKKNPFSGLQKKLKGIFTGSIFALAPLFIGGGLGVLLYWFFNITSSPVNCAVAVVAAVGTLSSMSKKNGLLFSLIFGAMSKFSDGKTPSVTAVNRVITGFSLGFAVSFPITFARYPLVLFLVGLVLLVAGIVLVFVGKNGTKKIAATLALMLMVGASLLPVFTVNVSAAELPKGSTSGDYVPYRGRLTYTNGRTNKYGQPFPDLMDFDMDGDIDYADRVLQHELVHNPDYLDQPGSPAAIAVIAVLTVLLGGGGAIAGTAAVNIVGPAAAEVLGGTVAETVGETIGNAVSGIDDLGPHISRDSDGDLNVIDPATGEKRLYINNGDGTYTNPMTDATYTVPELKSLLESRAENADLIRQDAAVAEEAVTAQRKANQGLSQIAKDYEAEKAKQAAQEAHDEYVAKLGKRYGVDSGDEDDIRAKIGYEQGKAEIESYEQQEYEGEWKNKQEYVETVEKVADTSIDVLADVTGRKDIKAAYTMTKNTLARTTEAYVNDKNIVVGLVQGATEGAIGVVQDNVDGAGAKLVANVVGETYKGAMDATINGKDMTEAVMGGIGKGLVNTGVDVGMDLVGDGVKGMMGDAADDAIKNALTEGAEVTKGSIVDGAKTLTNDLIKGGLDEAFKTPGEE